MTWLIDNANIVLYAIERRLETLSRRVPAKAIPEQQGGTVAGYCLDGTLLKLVASTLDMDFRLTSTRLSMFWPYLIIPLSFGLQALRLALWRFGYRGLRRGRIPRQH